MTRRDITQRYKGSYWGILWAVINPLLMLVIYTFVFSVVFNARWRPDEEMSKGEFAITLYAGLIAFNFFSEAINRSTGAILQFPSYVKKVVFPLEILVVVITGTALVNSLINIGVFLVASLLLLGKISPMVIFLPLLYIPLILLVLGGGWLLSSLGVYVRDIGQVVSVVTTVLFFMTPIFYPATAVPGRMQLIMKINPLAMIVENFRDVLVWSQMFSLKEWAIWTILLAILALLGYVWFINTKKGIADVL